MWVIDADATTANMKKSSQWSDELEKIWPMQLSALSCMSVTVTSNSLDTITDGKPETNNADIASKRKDEYILKITQTNGKIISGIFKILPGSRLQMMSEKRDEMAPIWKKGKAAKLDPNAGGKKVAEVMEKKRGVRSRDLEKEKQPIGAKPTVSPHD